MTIFYFVRHGETTYNKKGLVAGITDVALTMKGANATLECVKQFKANTPIDLCITSGMKRTIYFGTCVTKIYGPSFPIFHDARMKEKNNGVCEGVYWRHVTTQGFQRFYDDNPNHWHVGVPGGECHSQVWKRVALSLFQWSVMFPQSSILVGSHTEILRIIKGFKRITRSPDLTRILLANQLDEWPETTDLMQPILHLHTEQVIIDSTIAQKIPQSLTQELYEQRDRTS